MLHKTNETQRISLASLHPAQQSAVRNLVNHLRGNPLPQAKNQWQQRENAMIRMMESWLSAQDTDLRIGGYVRSPTSQDLGVVVEIGTYAEVAWPTGSRSIYPTASLARVGSVAAMAS